MSLAYVLSILHNIQHHSWLYQYQAHLYLLQVTLLLLPNAVLFPKKWARDSIARSDAIFYSYAYSMITRTR
jgi:hypothetical protein